VSTLIRKRKYLALFLTLVILLGLQPLAHGFDVGKFLIDVIGSLVLVTVFVVIFEGKLQRALALSAALAALASGWSAHFLPGDTRDHVLLVYHVLATLFLGAALFLILRGIFQEKTIQSDHFIGGLCGYLLAGLLFSNLYQVIYFLVPGSFAVKADVAWEIGEPHSRRFLFNFFSFVTISSMGTDQLSPVSPLASWLVCMEAIFGQFYVAVVVAQLVGLKLAQATRGEELHEQQALALKDTPRSSSPRE
jgi:hypothetical protein